MVFWKTQKDMQWERRVSSDPELFHCPEMSSCTPQPSFFRSGVWGKFFLAGAVGHGCRYRLSRYRPPPRRVSVELGVVVPSSFQHWGTQVRNQVQAGKDGINTGLSSAHRGM